MIYVQNYINICKNKTVSQKLFVNLQAEITDRSAEANVSAYIQCYIETDKTPGLHCVVSALVVLGRGNREAGKSVISGSFTMPLCPLRIRDAMRHNKPYRTIKHYESFEIRWNKRRFR